ncbi:MAG: sulfotransferase family protein [Chloroflexi bacterium]|nr:MAG: sulfotransferase family protein [Chloroflexota bacterium]
MTTLRINLWSGPRNVSTALMYSFAQRSDTCVVDEPLYAHYLRVSGAPHPGAAEVIASMESDGERVTRNLILGPCDRPVLFLKQMAHHLVDLSWDFLAETTNILLVRDPAQMLPSLAQNLAQPTLRDTGLALQSELYQYLRQLGQQPAVLDARQLLLDPRRVLGRLCEQLDLPFDEAMLHWPAGPRPEDGIWAKHWYHNVHRSTGFEPYREKDGPFPPRLLPLLDECRPHYEALAKVAIRADRD